MKHIGLLRTVYGRGRGLRLAASAMAAWLSVSLVISLQPCCEIFTGLFEQHAQAPSVTHADLDHRGDSTGPVSGQARDFCGHGASSGADLAKAVPVIPAKTSASPDGIAAALLAPLFSAKAPKMILASVYHPSPPPFRLYLRYLHLLI
jgi:hypothetical protein